MIRRLLRKRDQENMRSWMITSFFEEFKDCWRKEKEYRIALSDKS